ncbi:hypothetical protein BCU90_17430 [Vibrio lentus]|uniref:hypothetical protein n=1 Tax=Vibrio lentus TaxID=136468 RepID=UPI000C8670A3|nr:hypothetical protein [Vibrio lentus]PMG45646.1 hypothetical protein BCU90_17430 [Vibrio lentus]
MFTKNIIDPINGVKLDFDMFKKLVTLPLKALIYVFTIAVMLVVIPLMYSKFLLDKFYCRFLTNEEKLKDGMERLDFIFDLLESKNIELYIGGESAKDLMINHLNKKYGEVSAS